MWADTQSLLEELDESDWIQNCGRVVDAQDVRVISEWKNAIAVATDENGYEVLLEHANRIRDEVRARDIEAYRGWNTFVVAVRPNVRSIVDRKLSPDALGHPVPSKVVETYQLDRAARGNRVTLRDAHDDASIRDSRELAAARASALSMGGRNLPQGSFGRLLRE